MAEGLVHGPENNSLQVVLPGEDEEFYEPDEDGDMAQQQLSKALSNLPKYSDGSWQVHQQALEQWGTLNQIGEAVPLDWRKTALLYLLTGKAAERTATVGIGTPAFRDAASWNDMMDLLKNIFAPPADSEISRVAFRAQK